MRRFTLACAGVLACCATALDGPNAATAADETVQPRVVQIQSQSRQAALRWLGGQVLAFQRETWRWQRLMGVPRSPTHGRVLAELSVEHAQRAVKLWKARAAKARKRAQNPPYLRSWLCVHRYEGSWTANTGNGYYGGLQMNLGFQRAYGAHLLRTKGTADNWTPLEQIWVAEKARKTRGFWPWPNTARYCGLL